MQNNFYSNDPVKIVNCIMYLVQIGFEAGLICIVPTIIEDEVNFSSVNLMKKYSTFFVERQSCYSSILVRLVQSYWIKRNM